MQIHAARYTLVALYTYLKFCFICHHIFPPTMQVINPKKKAKKRNYKDSGELMVMNCKIEIVPTFLDYLQGG